MREKSYGSEICYQQGYNTSHSPFSCHRNGVESEINFRICKMFITHLFAVEQLLLLLLAHDIKLCDQQTFLNYIEEKTVTAKRLVESKRFFVFFFTLIKFNNDPPITEIITQSSFQLILTNRTRLFYQMISQQTRSVYFTSDKIHLLFFFFFL